MNQGYNIKLRKKGKNKQKRRGEEGTKVKVEGKEEQHGRQKERVKKGEYLKSNTELNSC